MRFKSCIQRERGATERENERAERVSVEWSAGQKKNPIPIERSIRASCLPLSLSILLPTSLHPPISPAHQTGVVSRHTINIFNPLAFKYRDMANYIIPPPPAPPHNPRVVQKNKTSSHTDQSSLAPPEETRETLLSLSNTPNTDTHTHKNKPEKKHISFSPFINDAFGYL